MFNLIQVEFLKLKNSKVFFLSLLAGLIPPFAMYVGALETLVDNPDFVLQFSSMFYNTHIYMVGLFAVFILCVIISNLIGKEYTDHTLKLVLTSPVSGVKFLASKYIVFVIWTAILMVVTFLGTILFGYLGGGCGLTLNLALEYSFKYLYGGFLLDLAMAPLIFLSMVLNNMVPSLITGAVLVFTNLFSYSLPWAPYSPWMASYLLSSGDVSQYVGGFSISWTVLLLTFVIGIAISYIYFVVKDTTK